MFPRTLSIAFFVGLITFATAIDSTCSGNATYKIAFQNLLTPENFGSLIPADGLVVANLAGVSHSNRQSFLTVRGFASRAVQIIAERGDVTRFVRMARNLRNREEGVKSVASTSEFIFPGKSQFVMLNVDCENPFVTVLGMVAPSPDWFVQISNMNMYDAEKKMFTKFMTGDLITYDAGTDDGRDFTNPDDLSLDMPSDPQLNIAPLVEDETDRFEGRPVGRYFIFRTA